MCWLNLSFTNMSLLPSSTFVYSFIVQKDHLEKSQRAVKKICCFSIWDTDWSSWMLKEAVCFYQSCAAERIWKTCSHLLRLVWVGPDAACRRSAEQHQDRLRSSPTLTFGDLWSLQWCSLRSRSSSSPSREGCASGTSVKVAQLEASPARPAPTTTGPTRACRSVGAT